jgi:hypothetical protein
MPRSKIAGEEGFADQATARAVSGNTSACRRDIGGHGVSRPAGDGGSAAGNPDGIRTLALGPARS